MKQKNNQNPRKSQGFSGPNASHSGTKVIIMYIIIAVLIIALGIILFNNYQEKQLTSAAEQGYIIGVKDAVVGVIENSRNCQYVNLTLGNQSYQLVDVECLK